MADPKTIDVGVGGGTITGLHLTILPRHEDRHKTPSLEHYRQEFTSRGIPVSSREIFGLMQSRNNAVQGFDRILNSPPIRMGDPDRRRKLAEKLADMTLDQTLQAQLSAEHPTALDNLKQDNNRTVTALTRPVTGAVPNLLKSVPALGASVTIWLPFSRRGP